MQPQPSGISAPQTSFMRLAQIFTGWESRSPHCSAMSLTHDDNDQSRSPASGHGLRMQSQTSGISAPQTSRLARIIMGFSAGGHGVQNAMQALLESLAEFTTSLCPYKSPKSWLAASKEQIMASTSSINQNYSPVDMILLPYSPYICATAIYQRLLLYTFIHVKLCGRDERLLSDFANTIDSWKNWDTITSLQNHLIMRESLFGVLDKCNNSHLHADPCDTGTSLQHILVLDMQAIFAHLTLVIRERASYETLRGLQGDASQSFLDLLQDVLDYQELGPREMALFVGALVKLSRASGCYPKCLVLDNVERTGTDPVAAGQFGEVYTGQMQGIAVAIKVLRVYVVSDVKRLLKEFSSEIVIWRQLFHPNILPFYGVHHLNGNRARVCLISPWMDNGNITQYLTRVPDANRAELVFDVALGIQYLHTMEPHVIHADLKGVNILITPSCRACLSDFGLAITIGSGLSGFSSTSSGRSRGTPRYQAPELLDHEAQEVHNTLASDMYSFGCVSYEIFSGHHPFYAITHEYRVAVAVINGNRPSRPPTSTAPGLDDVLWDTIEACWRHLPAERLTANEVVQKLRSGSVQPAPCDWDQSLIPRLRSLTVP